jgi:hypothetical protein
MTLCIAIKKEITASICPLTKGNCYWQHRRTHACCYTEQDMDSQQFAKLVGMSNYPNPEQISRFLHRLRIKLQEQ